MTDPTPIRGANGRFLPGAPGRPKGARNKVAPPLIRLFAERHGRQAEAVLAFLEANRFELGLFLARRKVAADNAGRQARRLARAALREQR